MSKEAMTLALEAFQRLDLWLKVRYQVGLVGFELDAIKALEEALAKQEQDEPKKKWKGQIDNDEFFESLEQEQDEHLSMQVRPSEFAELIKGKETVTGIPAYWAEWPNKEKP